MPNYKTTDVAAGQSLFMVVNFKQQLLPGTFEHMLDEIIGTKIDISVFDRKYKNDLTGASAIPPAALLKLIIYAYSKGCISSRKIMWLNKDNIIAKALTGNMEIHWTTIADFICGNSEDFSKVFEKVLLYCNELGLIGGEMYTVDGLRLPSNASIDMSGTEEELKARLALYRKMAEKHMAKHLKHDREGEMTEVEKKHFEERQKHLKGQAEKISDFLEKMEKKIGLGGEEIKSNVTDNESAVIHSSKGFLQGYIGIAVTDEKKQIIINAEAVGTANEGEHLPELLNKAEKNLKEAGVEQEEGKKRTVLCDSNYFSEDNLRACEERGIEAAIPDGQAKRRQNTEGEKRFGLNDFQYNEAEDYYECPNGKRLIYKRETEQKGVKGKVYQASLTDCKACLFFSKCSWSKKEQSKLNQGKTLRVTEKNGDESLCRKMREKQGTEEFQEIYANRMGIAEPPFANIRYCKGLDRFTLRGKKKVNGQWLLYSMVHNLGKCLNELNRRRHSA
jgi:transposase